MSEINESKVIYSSKNQILENKKYPFSKGQLHHFLNNRHKNGLEAAIRKIGKRIYFRLDLFDAWIEKQGQKGGKK